MNAKNIPYEVRAGVTFLEKAHIKDLIAHLRIIENPYDEISWSRIFTLIPGIGTVSASKIFTAISKTGDPVKNLLSKTFVSKDLKGSRILKNGIKNLTSHAKHLEGFTVKDIPSEVIKSLVSVLEDHIKTKYDNWQDRLDDLGQLSVYAQNYPTIQKLLENLSLNSSNLVSKTVLVGDQTKEEKPLVLSTIHRAKGLEWRIVFIPMLCEDSFPSGRVVGDPEAFEEERRVFYVATTRTKDQLYLISPAIRNVYGRPQTARISQFVNELHSKVYKKSTVLYKPSPSKNKISKKKNASSFTTADKIGKK